MKTEKKYYEILLPKNYDWKKIKGVPVNLTRYFKELENKRCNIKKEETVNTILDLIRNDKNVNSEFKQSLLRHPMRSRTSS